MSNNKKLIIGILALVVTCVIGYALFSETVSIKGTAEAKGDFDIGISCETGLSSKLNFPSELNFIEGGYSNDSCVVKENKVQLSSSLSYVTASRYFTVKIKNNGNINISLLENSVTINNFTVAFTDKEGNIYKNNNGEEEKSSSEDFPWISGTNYAIAIESNGKMYNCFGDDFDAMNNDFYHWNGNSHPGDLILEPGETAYFIFNVTWPDDPRLHLGYTVSSDLHGGSDKVYISFNGDIVFPFQQAKVYE